MRNGEGILALMRGRCVINEDRLAEVFRGMLLTRGRLIGFGVIGLVWVGCLGAIIWLAAIGMLTSTLLWEFLALSLAIAGLLVWTFGLMPRQQAKLQMRRRRELSGEALAETCVCLLEDEMSQETDAEVVYLQYASLKRVIVTKTTITLCTQANQLLLLDKTRLEGGSVAELWKLLGEKAPDLKLPKLP